MLTDEKERKISFVTFCKKGNLLHLHHELFAYFLTYLVKISNINSYFILSPPYSGSTMLNQLISSSGNVSCNNNLGTREGQLLPGVKQFYVSKR